MGKPRFRKGASLAQGHTKVSGRAWVRTEISTLDLAFSDQIKAPEEATVHLDGQRVGGRQGGGRESRVPGKGKY